VNSVAWKSRLVKICVIGPGRIGGNLAQRFAQAGHDVVTTFARDADSAASTLASASISFESDGRTAVRGAEVVVVAVPWGVIDDAWASIGGDSGDAVIVDTTNPFGPNGMICGSHKRPFTGQTNCVSHLATTALPQPIET
jgi:predicted dinucleotide-binding enzyme